MGRVLQPREWIAQLLACGLLRRSFVPPLPQRELRDLTRTSLLQDRSRSANRLQKVLEDANVKLAGEHHRFMLKLLLDQVEQYEQQVAKLDQRIEEVMSPLEKMALGLGV